MNIANFRSCYVLKDFARVVPIILGGRRTILVPDVEIRS